MASTAGLERHRRRRLANGNRNPSPARRRIACRNPNRRSRKLQLHHEPASYDLIAICYYLERKLFEPAKRALVPGGILIAIALLAEPGKDNSFRVEPGELPRYFDGWEILHHREGRDAWQHNVAEIVARKPI